MRAELRVERGRFRIDTGRETFEGTAPRGYLTRPVVELAPSVTFGGHRAVLPRRHELRADRQLLASFANPVFVSPWRTSRRRVTDAYGGETFTLVVRGGAARLDRHGIEVGTCGRPSRARRTTTRLVLETDPGLDAVLAAATLVYFEWVVRSVGAWD